MGQPHGPIWELCFNLALICDLTNDNKKFTASEIIKKYSEFYEFIYKYNLQNIYNLKTLIDVSLIIIYFH